MYSKNRFNKKSNNEINNKILEYNIEHLYNSDDDKISIPKFNELTDKEKKSVSILGKLSGVSPGAIAYYASNKIPKGWIECDGRELKIKDYRRLFDNIKYMYTPDDKKEDLKIKGTFLIPDFRGTFLRSFDSKNTNRIDVERNSDWADKNNRTIQSDELKTHNHTANSENAGSQIPTGNINIVMNDNTHTHSWEINESHSTEDNKFSTHKDGHYHSTGDGGNITHWQWASRWGDPKGTRLPMIYKFTGALSGDDYRGAHRHSISPGGNHSHSVKYNLYGDTNDVDVTPTAQNPGSVTFNQIVKHNHNLNIENSGTESRPKNIALIVCIKY